MADKVHISREVAFGNRLGFANAWSYWITAWPGDLMAIAVIVSGFGALNGQRRHMSQPAPVLAYREVERGG